MSQNSQKFTRVVEAVNVGNMLSRFKPIKITNIDSLGQYMDRLRTKNPGLHGMVQNADIRGVAVKQPGGAFAQFGPVSLRDILANPNDHIVTDESAFKKSFDGLSLDAAKQFGPKAGNALKWLPRALGFAAILPAAYYGIEAYNQMHAPGESGPTTDNPSAPIDAVNSDPAMSSQTDPAAAFGYNGGKPTPGVSSAPTMPSFVTSPNVYTQDPLMQANFDNLGALVQTPPYYNYDSTGYIRSDVAANDVRRFAGFGQGFGLLTGSVNPTVTIAQTNPQPQAQASETSTSGWGNIPSPMDLLHSLGVTPPSPDEVLNKFYATATTNPGQAAQDLLASAAAADKFLAAFQPYGLPGTGAATTAGTQLNFIRVSQGIGEVLDTARDITHRTQDSTGTSADQDEPGMDKGQDGMNDYVQNQQGASTMFQMQGLNRDAYNQAQQAFQAVGMEPTNAASFLQNLTALASQSAQPVSSLIPTAIAIVRRNPGDLQRAESILTVIAKYASEHPNAGVWEMANNAATGKPFMEQLSAMRLTNLNFSPESLENGTAQDQSNDLYYALGGIVNPNSDLGKLNDARAMAVQHMRQQKDKMALTWQAIWSQYAAERNNWMAKEYTSMTAKLARWSQQPWFQSVMKGVNSIIAGFSLWETILKNFGVKGRSILKSGGDQPYAPQGNGYINTSSISEMLRRVFAQNAQQYQYGQSQPTYDSAQPQPTTPQPQTQGQSGQTQQSPWASAPNMGADVSQAAQQAQGAQQGAASGNVADFAKYSATISKEFNNITQQLSYIASYHQQFQSALGVLEQGMSMGGDQALGLEGQNYFSPEAILQQIPQIGNMAQQYWEQIENFKAYINRITAQAISEIRDPNVKQALQVTANTQSNNLEQEAMKARSGLLLAQQMRITLPIEVDITNRIQPQVEYYKNMAQMMPFQTPQTVGPLVSLYSEMSQLHNYASQQYINGMNSIQDPNTRAFFEKKALDHKNKAMAAFQQGQITMRSLGNSIAGESDMGGMNGAFASSTKFVRVADNSDNKEADKELQEYWDKLLPGFGTALEDPVGKEGVPTDELAPKNKFKRVRPKVDLSQ